MIKIIDTRFDRTKVIPNLTYIPRKGDILVYNDDDLSIRGVIYSVLHDIYNDERGVFHDITIKVY